MNSKSHQIKSDSLSPSTLRAMKDRTLILATIAEVRKTGDQLSRFLVYANEARKRFDNRGRGTRVISGYRGWEDFVERGLQTNIRTFQRRLAEFNDPNSAIERRKKDRERDFVQKVNTQTDATIHFGHLAVKGCQEAVRPYVQKTTQTQTIPQPYVEYVTHRTEFETEPAKVILATVEPEPQSTRELSTGLAAASAPESVERIFLAVTEHEAGIASAMFAIYTDAASNTAAAEHAERIAKAHDLGIFGGRSYRLLRK